MPKMESQIVRKSLLFSENSTLEAINEDDEDTNKKKANIINEDEEENYDSGKSDYMSVSKS